MMNINCLEQKWMLTTYNNVSLLLFSIYLQSILIIWPHVIWQNFVIIIHPWAAQDFLVCVAGRQHCCEISNSSDEITHFWQLHFFLICHFDPQNKAFERRFIDWFIHFIYWKIIHFLMRKLWKILENLGSLVKGI